MSNRLTFSIATYKKMKSKQITITYPEERLKILSQLKYLKQKYHINISAYCADAIQERLEQDNRTFGR